MKKQLLTIGTVATITLSSVFFANPASAEKTLNEVKTEQNEVSAKLTKAEAKVAKVLIEMKDINDEINRLNIALEENKKAVKKTEKKIAKLEKDIPVLEKDIEKRTDTLKERLAAYQANGGNAQFIEVLFGATDPIDFISRAESVSTIANADLELIEEIATKRAKLDDKIQAQEDSIAEEKEQIETITAQTKQQKTKIVELKEKEEKFQAEKAALQTESSELNALEAEIRASLEAPRPTVAEDTQTSSNTNTNSNATENTSSATEQTSAPAPKKEEPKQNKVAYTGGGGSAIAAGKQFIGNSSYSWGGKNPSAGLFDCSGFVQWAYEQEGVSLPRTASAMKGVGKSVSYSDAQPGDLVFFNGGTHVGIYVGGGKFLGSQNSTGVAIADMNSGYWANGFDGVVKRVK